MSQIYMHVLKVFSLLNYTTAISTIAAISIVYVVQFLLYRIIVPCHLNFTFKHINYLDFKWFGCYVLEAVMYINLVSLAV